MYIKILSIFLSIILFVFTISYLKYSNSIDYIKMIRGYNFNYFYSANFFIYIILISMTLTFIGNPSKKLTLLFFSVVILTIVFKKIDHIKSYIIGISDSVSKGADYKSTFENELLKNIPKLYKKLGMKGVSEAYDEFFGNRSI